MKNLILFAISTLVFSGCKFFGSSDSATHGVPADITPEPTVNGAGCGTLKILTENDLGIWRMPHSWQNSQVTAKNGIDVNQVTVAVVNQKGSSPVVYFVNGKMPSQFTTESQKIEWLQSAPGGKLDVTSKKTLEECSTDYSLTWLGSSEVGCFDTNKCRIVWIGDHQTNCEISAENGQFYPEQLINCGELKMDPNAQPYDPESQK